MLLEQNKRAPIKRNEKDKNIDTSAKKLKFSVERKLKKANRSQKKKEKKKKRKKLTKI